ncbi:hypothetical protein [Nostoc sp.]|uniref:hypothetical protein n=1 Tax=Nostoc sp. TaxID=1180 RepID=UPI002FF63D6C
MPALQYFWVLVLYNLAAHQLSLVPEQDMVFGYHVHLQGGKVMKLETPTFNEHWGSRGGLVEFQNRVVKALKLKR